MTDGDALYRAIVARPEDDTPRLVYADWLEEHGRAEEAEFIRLDCKFEASTPDLPEYIDLNDRIEELRIWLQAHAPRSFKLPRGISLDEDNWWKSTGRGFPLFFTADQVRGRLGKKGVRKRAAAFEIAFATLPAQCISVNFVAIEDLAEFLKEPVLAAIDIIDISVNVNGHAGDEAARLIAACPYLGNVSIASLDFPIGEAGAVALAGSEHFKRMEAIFLHAAQFTPAAIRALSSGNWFHGLRELALGRQEALASEAFEELCRLPPFPHLHTLHLPNNRFPAFCWEVFSRTETFPQLSRLELNDSDVSDGQLEALAAAKHLRLTKINLSRSSNSDDGIVALVAAPCVGSLQWLDLSRARIRPRAARSIARSPKLSNLKHLNLTSNSIGNSGFKSIAASPSLRNVTTLLLGECAFDPRPSPVTTGHAFLERLDMPKLRRLSLSSLPLDAKTAQLLTHDKFRTLTRLDLAFCRLSDQSVAELIRSSTLQGLIELNLNGNSINTGAAPLIDRRLLPRLSWCSLLIGNPIAADLRRKLRRRPGILISAQ